MPSASFPCRDGCGACCIAPSIASPIPGTPGTPGMPQGKPAGVPCVQLDADYRCKLFGRSERPAFCASLKPGAEMCGTSRGEAISLLSLLEQLTCP